MTEKEMRQPVVAWLGALNHKCAHECYVSGGYCDVIGFRFATQTTRKIPPLESVITVELKVKDIGGVIRQGVENKRYANYSYAAMPSDIYDRMKPSSIQKFTVAGVGLLVVYYPSGQVIERITPKYNQVDIDKHKKKWWAWQRRALNMK